MNAAGEKQRMATGQNVDNWHFRMHARIRPQSTPSFPAAYTDFVRMAKLMICKEQSRLSTASAALY